MNTTHATLNLFNGAISYPHLLDGNFVNVNHVSMKYGYIVHPDICSAEVLAWVKTHDTDFSATFYKTWDAVVSKSRNMLWVDQAMHYASTYGTNFEGDVYLPEGVTPVIPDIKIFKVLMPLTVEDVIARCEKMLFSGIALKQETMEMLVGILFDLNHSINIDMVKNKEAKMFLHKKLDKVPSEPQEMVRYLVYLATEKTLLIKDKATLDAIKSAKLPITGLVNKFGVARLSEVFHRNKAIFLAFKTDVGNNAIINKLRKFADKYHKPKPVGYFETLLSDPSRVGQLPEKLKGLNNFKKVALLQTIAVRLKSLDMRVYPIRNQKLYIETGIKPVKSNRDYLKLVYSIIYDNLVASLWAKACNIKLPQGVNLTLPVTEKSFIGNYPIGSSFDLSDSDCIVGINWKGEEGAWDLDLSLVTIDGKKYGWNAAYYNERKSVVYSGDMTSADPQATELFYAKKGFTPSIVKVNMFNGGKNSKFKFFLAKENLDNKNFHNRMVDPNNVVVMVDAQMDSKEKSLGVITGDKFVLAQFRTGKGRVASGDSITNKYTDYVLNTIDCYVSLNQLLLDAGFNITDTEPAIDLTNLSKDTLIDLLR